VSLSDLPWGKLRKGLDDPRHFRPTLLYVARRVNARLNRRRISPDPPAMTEDWDTLIILDACRHDSFVRHRDVLDVDGTLSRRVSPASSSMEFMQATFVGESHHDTVYVTANPHVEFLAEDVFHDVELLIDDESWDAELDTVTPQTVVDAARDARETYPNKRLVLHFMQPHYPFIGELGREIPHRGYFKSLVDPDSEEPSIWSQLRKYPDAFDLDFVKRAYEENLVVALDALNDYLSDLQDERVVVTADHGNFLGERLWPIPVSDFGHPGSAFAPATVYVPWFEIEGDDRPTIQSDPPVDSGEGHTDETVTSRLQALGYQE
jgi:hypothetical protein